MILQVDLYAYVLCICWPAACLRLDFARQTGVGVPTPGSDVAPYDEKFQDRPPGLKF